MKYIKHGLNDFKIIKNKMKKIIIKTFKFIYNSLLFIAVGILDVIKMSISGVAAKLLMLMLSGSGIAYIFSVVPAEYDLIILAIILFISGILLLGFLIKLVK